MSPEERLAKITGRPVEQSPPSPIESPMPNGVADEEIPTTTYTSSSNVDDPPLENLTRDPFTAETPTAEGEFLSNILGGQSNQTTYIDPVQFLDMAYASHCSQSALRNGFLMDSWK